MLRLLVNLVDNARKFTPASGTVVVGMDADDASTTFTVADSGPGIPAEERERIFKPYYQRAQPSMGRSDGVGLGLVIVKAIVDLHQGTIVIDSVPGRGCTFRITLPQRQDELTASTQAAEPGARGP